jgi:hypothetical protein
MNDWWHAAWTSRLHSWLRIWLSAGHAGHGQCTVRVRRIADPRTSLPRSDGKPACIGHRVVSCVVIIYGIIGVRPSLGVRLSSVWSIFAFFWSARAKRVRVATPKTSKNGQLRPRPPVRAVPPGGAARSGRAPRAPRPPPRAERAAAVRETRDCVHISTRHR